MYLISPGKAQYKANLHCHSVRSDGKKTAEELKQMYKGAGYSVLAITDHEAPQAHCDLTDPEFIAITGYEAYIRTGTECRYDAYAKEIHINLFARDPKNEAIVCFNPKYCKYISEAEKAELKKVGSQETRCYSVEYINKFVREAKENGYIAAYNHPVWSLEDEADILRYEGFFSMEMYNHGSYLINGQEYNGALYNKMLMQGIPIACHSADDNHNDHPTDSPYSDSFGGWAMLMPTEFTYDALIEAMEKGEMYSSTGPAFKEISIEGNKLHVECSDVARITVFTGSKRPGHILAPAGTTVNQGDFEIDERAKYVQISITDRDGGRADTRGYFRHELPF